MFLCVQWLSQTIMVPVAKEIKSVNVSLKKLGSKDYTIGSKIDSHYK